MTISEQVPAFDQLHVVSDLHLGGEPGHQIFKQGDRLAKFIEKLEIAPPPAPPTCLVLNGDIVDFLADKEADYLDPLGAVKKLEKIFKDKAFKMVLKAFKKFVKRRNAHLTLTLGNHDVELALPHVRQWLLDKISGGNARARGRMTLAFDGAGYRCSVGGKQVLCVHGNEVDNWNLVDHLALLGVSRALNRGLPPPEWNANAGTRLVIDVMNDIKKDFPMVDLLKPETEAAVPVVVAISPWRLKDTMKILRAARAVGALWKDKIRRAMGFLSAEEVEKVAPSEAEVTAQFLGEHFGSVSTAKNGANVADMLMRSQEAIKNERDPKDDQDEQEFLGLFDAFTKSKKKGDEETLRLKLKDKLAGRSDFELTGKDETFTELDEEVAPEIDYLIAGHTHLHRAIRRKRNKYYFNSGTWIRLIRVDRYLDDKEQFSRIYKAFKAKSLEALDKLNDLGEDGNESLVLRRSTVVSIFRVNKKTYGELRDVREDGTMESFENSQLPRRDR